MKKVVCPRCVPGEKRGFQQVLWIVDVPINKIFEHLDATIADATPLYELCASVLESRSAVNYIAPNIAES